MVYILKVPLKDFLISYTNMKIKCKNDIRFSELNGRMSEQNNFWHNAEEKWFGVSSTFGEDLLCEMWLWMIKPVCDTRVK